MLELPAFRNEIYADFSQPSVKAAMLAAQDEVRAQFGREYELLLDGVRVRTGKLLHSSNPSNPDEIVGSHHNADPGLASKAVEDSYAYFEEWSRTPAQGRVGMVLRVAAILRARKFEFNAWLVFEAGKTWPEAEAETGEAIDFCEYYARQMLRYLPADSSVQMPGEKGEQLSAARRRGSNSPGILPLAFSAE
ncbi:MAG: aldehyde dehydrogenase family protein [Bryobacteraceae bacterium]